METTKRLNFVDLIESLAIFFVILYHSTLYYFDFTADSSFINYLNYFLRTILSTCVPLFFFMNGYLLFNRPFNLKMHIYKIIRIIALIVIWSVVLMPLYLWIAGEPISIKTILLSILNLDTTWGMNFFWFLGALICIYILFPALKALYDSNKKAFVFFTIVCALLTFGLVFIDQIMAFVGIVSRHWIGNIDYPVIVMLNPFRGSYGYAFVYFCIGGLAFAYEDKIRSISKIKRTVISSLGILFSCVLLLMVGVFYTKYIDGAIWDVVWNGYDTIFTFFNVIFIYILGLNYNKEIRFIKNVSINTLGIYLTHGLIIRLTRPLIKQVDFLRNFPVNIIYAFLILCVCLVICMAFKKIPLLKKML